MYREALDVNRQFMVITASPTAGQNNEQLRCGKSRHFVAGSCRKRKVKEVIFD